MALGTMRRPCKKVRHRTRPCPKGRKDSKCAKTKPANRKRHNSKLGRLKIMAATGSRKRGKKRFQQSICLARHGHGEHQLTGPPIWSAALGPSLTTIGRQQAQLLATVPYATVHLVNDEAGRTLVVTSHARRAMQTAAPLVSALRHADALAEWIVHPDAREVNCCEGTAPSRVHADFPDADLTLYERAVAAAGGSAAYRRRLANAPPEFDFGYGACGCCERAGLARARRLARWLRSRPERSIFVVAHGGLLHMLMHVAHQPRQVPRRTPYTAIPEVTGFWNDTVAGYTVEAYKVLPTRWAFTGFAQARGVKRGWDVSVGPQ